VIASVETAWLFTRGPESVRIVRAVTPGGELRLIVNGPGDSTEVHVFDDVVACVTYQSELERRLVAQGYSLERFTSERRSGRPDRRQRSRTDRRRHGRP
jgi:hypothetical protein